MGRLSGFSGREVMRVAKSEGWVHLRTSGDHLLFRKPGRVKNAAIPDHRVVKEGTLRDLVRTMEITSEEFIRRATRQTR